MAPSNQGRNLASLLRPSNGDGLDAPVAMATAWKAIVTVAPSFRLDRDSAQHVVKLCGCGLNKTKVLATVLLELEIDVDKH